MVHSLDPVEMAGWTAWKRAGDVVMRAVEREITAATGLSAADFAVLIRLVELGDGSLRQQELAKLLGWERSRLSRQISRMQTRGLVDAASDGPARMITATDTGRDHIAAARPAHAAAVRRTLLQLVPPEDAAAFWSTVDKIAQHP
ncbi:MarR family winged helix-turn-helix transcriptional regulator [Winogradskya humida]|uniref:MarR family transcriptional regulator n=1 Tax=Winogradskya humida TaxID=113566 RepID=A0ABQ3ZX33_9ACTN|nr:MarR family winged helix-turn-helix transcriptional regulator [Actinoplanes humidus]GIE23134.1 MarR family transcriptional regulator [Actinoplanes humidus]